MRVDPALLIMADSAFFSSPPLGVERPGEAGGAAGSPIAGSFSYDIDAFPTSPCLSAPMGRRGERVDIEHNGTEQPGGFVRRMTESKH